MADPVSFSTEQELPFSFVVLDGRDRPVAIDGVPTVASSDETVATVSVVAGDGNAWNGTISSVAASPDGTTQRVTITADADLGEGVKEVIGVLEFSVKLDERTSNRIVKLSVGAPVDKPV